MNRNEIILELVKSLNMGNSGYINDRVHYAKTQYTQLVKEGLINDNGWALKVQEEENKGLNKENN